MSTATREAGLPKSYYAPEFSIQVDGADLKLEDKFDVLEIVVTMDVENLTSVDIKLNNYDDRTFDLKWSDSDKFKIGAKVHVRLGYADQLRSMLSGYITTLTPNFPSEGAPTLGVRVMDPLVKLKGSKPPQDQVMYKNMTDAEIAKRIARRHNLRFQIDDSKPKYTVIDQENLDDAQFLKVRAKAINYNVFIRTDPTKDDDVLYFVRPADGVGRAPIRTYVLAWGTLRNTDVAPSLIEFKPTIAASHQVKSVTVRGWDADTKKPISVTATPGNTADVMGQPGGKGTDAATELGGQVGKEEVVVERYVETEEEAMALAKALLAQRSYAYKTAKGKLIGLPDLRLNDNVEISGVGERFGGLYHVKKVIHTLNERGYVTEFEARGA
jgi:Bacteriophage probable baseplate hub protein